jgi:hypothetical protein
VTDRSGPTGIGELDGLLREVAGHATATFGPDLAGVYLVGSFALGDADEHSDCDFLVVLRAPPTDAQEAAVRQLWAELPTRPGTWTRDLEGSYAQWDDLTDPDRVGRPWLFVDHGHTEVTRDDHCNREVVRWTLREHGVVLSGPEPRTFVARTSPEAIRARMRQDLATLVDDILGWAPTDVAWTQRYVVTTCCRVLYSLATGEVTSKRAALLWAEDTLDPRWRPLLEQVRLDRERGWDPADPPRPGSLEAAYDLVAWSRARAGTV